MNLKFGMLGVALTVASASQAFTYNTFLAWGTSDSTLGISGYAIEDFEDVNLVTSLQVGITSANGNFGPSSTLPNTFKPSDDAFGTAFTFGGGGAWDGTHGLINTRTNQTFSYSESGSWGDIDLFFAGGSSSVGFSVQQMEANNILWINGVQQGAFSALFPTMNLDGARQGYVRIDAGIGETINSIFIDNVGGDGYMIDHVAFAVPEPASFAVLTLGLLALVRRKRTN